MKTIETIIQRQTRATITEILEEVIDVPREYWEFVRTRQDTEVMIRQIYAYLLNKYTSYSQQTIADLLGLKNHSTIIRNLNVVKSWLDNPTDYPEQISIINKAIELYEQRNS